MSFYHNNFDLNDSAVYYTACEQQDDASRSQGSYNSSSNLLYTNSNNMPLSALDQLPVFEYITDNSMLQDDNFSIATTSDLYPQLLVNSPSLLPTGDSIQLMTPNSTPSPQLSSVYHHQRNISFDSFFFVPVLPNPLPKRRVSSTSVTEKRHVCPVCNHRSKRRHNLVEHMLTHNPHRPKSFLCTYCSRPFARKYDMKRHEKIHLKK